MKADLTKPILDLDGETIRDEKGKPLTMGNVFRRALMAISQSDNESKKLEKYDLAISCAGGEVELNASDVRLIMSSVAEAFAPLILGRVRDEIDPKKGSNKSGSKKKS